MRIIVVNPKKDFKIEQIKALKEVGDVEFVENKPNYNNKIFTDSESKLLALSPENIDWKISNRVLSSMPNLHAVCIPTTSYSWVDGKELRKRKVVLTNVPKYSTESVAEYAITMMLNLARKLPLVIDNKWKIDYDTQEGWEVRGKVMGIVGLGAIGTRIAELGNGLGMKVIYWSKKSRDKRFEYSDLNTLLKTSDFIFPAMAKNEKTNKMLNKHKLKLLKKNSFIVSITGEELLDLDFSLSLLKNGKLKGIAIESDKYVINSHKFRRYKGFNLLVTPPIAWLTKEASEEDMRIWTDTIISCIKGKPINVVN